MQRYGIQLSSLLVLLLATAAGAAAVHAKPLVPGPVPPQTRPTAGEDQPEPPANPLRQSVTLDLVDAPLGSALEAIARHAGLTLAYNADALPAGRTVTLHASALPVRDALARALDGTGLEPSMIRNGRISLTRQPKRPTARSGPATSRSQEAVVTGTVADAGTAEPLRGAEVRVNELELSTITDVEGRYTLENVPPGTHVVVASMIGYGAAQEEITVAEGASVLVDFALEVSAVALDEMIVTGTMVPTQMRAVPSPVSVLTAEDIERKGVAHVEDILRSVPGLGIVGSGGDDARLFYVYVRGANSLGANTIKTYVDGVELANPVYSLNQIDPGSIDRIELVRGPQASTLYGSEAIAGVLQIFTKKGRRGLQDARLQATVSGGSLESDYATGFTQVQNHSVTMSGGGERASFSLGASYRHTGEWVEDELIDELGWNLDNSATSDFGMSGGLSYSLGRLTAEVTARFHANSAGFPISRALADAARSGEWNYSYATKPQGIETALEAQTYGLNVQYRATRSWTHHLAVGHDRTTVEFRQPQPRMTVPADSLLVYQSLDWTRRSVAYRTALDLELGPDMSSVLQAGFDRSSYGQHEVITLDAVRLTGPLGNQTADLTLGDLVNHGFFVQAQAAWRNQLFLTGGLRSDRSSGFGDDLGYAWSPRVGLAHVLELGRSTIKARVSYGTAIRAPQPEQKLGRTGGTFVTLPNEQLAAEAQTGYDLGLEFHFADDASIAVTRYDQTAEDLVALVRLSEPTDIPQIQQHQNVGQINNRGWEFEGTASIAGLNIKGHWSILESTVQELSPTYSGTDFVVGQGPLWVPGSTGELSVTRSTDRATITVAVTHKGSWNAYRNLPYFEALLGTDPDREPFRGNRADYVDAYPSVRRYRVNGSYRITDDVTALFTIDNLLNDKSPERTDIDMVKGRQVVIGLRADLGL